MRFLALAFLASAAASSAAWAQEASSVYTLGELQVTARTRQGEQVGGSVIAGEAMETFDKSTLDRALDLAPGVNGGNTGGSRNERLIFVRGFDRFQTTLSIDGVRVFLPADNRIDFARFLTADLSEIQISKGYVSVIDGPGGLGGAINLVTRKPNQPFEARFGATSFLSQDGEQEGYQVSGLIGGVVGDVYVQASGALADRDGFSLSEDFRPTALENGGLREHSESRDWRANIKAGWAPNDTDEYSINLSRQEGEKNAPYHVTDTANTRFWSWPYWNLDSIAFLSRTALTDQVTVRTRLYANHFTNLLSAYDSAAQNTQTLPRAFNSYYDDKAVGGNVQVDVEIAPTDLLKAAFYVRVDEHMERQDGFIRVNTPNLAYSEPWQTTKEATYSLALENTLQVGDAVDLIAGVSYDWTDLSEAQEYNFFVTGTAPNQVLNQAPVNYPLRNTNALNGQAALTWRASDDMRLHLSVSSRTRFPTLFERFSARMGAAIPNPDIEAERATNYEIGVERDLSDTAQVKAAVFYSDVTDALILIPVSVTGFGTVNQTKNAGDGEYYGFEASFTANPTEWLAFGANYTYLRRNLTDPSAANAALPKNQQFRPTGTPNEKLFVYAEFKPIPAVSLIPSLEAAGDRWTVASPAPLIYYRTGDYALLNLAAEWRIGPAELAVGARNLTDQNYRLVDGFPEEGRSFYASVRARF